MAEDARVALYKCMKRHLTRRLCYRLRMSPPDLNLLLTLEALLAEGSVAGAARRLKLSPSAMSRALARLRQVMGDPLLVRCGRALVPTPRAQEIRDRVGTLVPEVQALLRPAAALDLQRLERSFTLRTADGFVENFGPGLIARVRQAAPGVRLHFVHKSSRDSQPLRDGSVDLETGVVGPATAPELKTQALFRDRFIGVVRAGHPLCAGELSIERYAGADHIQVTRQGQDHSRIDATLAERGLSRRVLTRVDGFATALALVRATDLVATVPERHTATLCAGLHRFDLPLSTPAIPVALLWHPRLDADPAHRWLRACLREVVAQPAEAAP
jgi:DNA-binding transcriptional LysR family regulator